ncbi:hypothetical protein L210DRAFT_3387545 [Boletus edulis BED1]|uniref:Uncharacterized protein n=1 Tax=Boletus edulis BED1 TaxID=1328754 RepID=A0AAD4C6Z3_BOLED|nr:hypothetical protein L210DRAFT_3387545 [Boletus edulis BED1]
MCLLHSTGSACHPFILPFWVDWGDTCPSIFLTPNALHQWHKFYYNHHYCTCNG